MPANISCSKVCDFGKSRFAIVFFFKWFAFKQNEVISGLYIFPATQTDENHISSENKFHKAFRKTLMCLAIGRPAGFRNTYQTGGVLIQNGPKNWSGEPSIRHSVAASNPVQHTFKDTC